MLKLFLFPFTLFACLLQSEVSYDWTQGFMCEGKCQTLANEADDVINFKWNSTGWNQPHDLMEMASKEAFDACNFTDAVSAMGGDAATMIGAYEVAFQATG